MPNMPNYKNISIILPTCNRQKELLECLESFKTQIFPKDNLEIIIVDDGSDIPVQNYVNIQSYGINIQILRQEKNYGPARARNLAINKAKNDIIIFVNDDIILTQDFLMKHLNAHNLYSDINVAVLGKIDWLPSLRKTALMHYISEIAGLQFAYYKIQNYQDAGFEHFYTANISIKNQYLTETAELFCEKFTKPSFEDIELSYRLERRWFLRIIYLEDILVYHNHSITLPLFYKRQFDAGQMSVVFYTEHEKMFREETLYVINNAIPIYKDIPQDDMILYNKMLEAKQESPPEKQATYFNNFFENVLKTAYLSGKAHYIQENKIQ